MQLNLFMRAIVFTLLLIGAECQANSVWIHVTGYFANPKESPEAAYKQAENFARACILRGLRPIKECRIYSFQKNALKHDPQISQFVIGMPRRAIVLSDIWSTVNNAREKDKIVISFASHGGLVRAGSNSTSCVVVYSRGKNEEKICDTDLKDIFAARPEAATKAQYFIIASSCMSGGFQSLAEKNVCTYTAGVKYRWTYPVNENNLWKYLAHNTGKTLADLGGISRQLTDRFYQDYQAIPIFDMAGFRSAAIQTNRCLYKPRAAPDQSLINYIVRWKKDVIRGLESSDFEKFRQTFFTALRPDAESKKSINPPELKGHLDWQNRIMTFIKAHGDMSEYLCKKNFSSFCDLTRKLRELDIRFAAAMAHLNEGRDNFNWTPIEKLNRDGTLLLGLFQREVSGLFCLMNLDKDIDPISADYLRQIGVDDKGSYLEDSDQALQEAQSCEQNFVL